MVELKQEVVSEEDKPKTLAAAPLLLIPGTVMLLLPKRKRKPMKSCLSVKNQ